MAAARKPRAARASAPAGATVTLSREDLSALIAEQLAKTQTQGDPTNPMQRQLDLVLEELRARPAERPAADVDAGSTHPRGTLVTLESSASAANQQAAFTAFNYRAFLQAAKPYAKAIKLNCDRFHYPVLDAFIQIAYESGFDARAKSTTGAIGLAQILPDRAKEFGIDPTDPDAAIRTLVMHMSEYRETYLNDSRAGGAQLYRLPPPGEAQSAATLNLALAAWDSSPEAVDAVRGVPAVASQFVGIVGGTIQAILSSAPGRARWIEDWNALLR